MDKKLSRELDITIQYLRGLEGVFTGLGKEIENLRKNLEGVRPK